MIINFENFLKEYMDSDAIGYDIGEFIYHVTPESNVQDINTFGFIPKNGITINNNEYNNRLYFATSLIAAYDISVNFNSYKSDENYVIFKVDSKCLKNYDEDPLFVHGIYIDYPISIDYIVDVYDASELFDKFNDDDFDELYEKLYEK